MEKQKIVQVIKIFIFGTFVFGLVFLVCETGHTLMSNSLGEQFKIDKKTSGYISFNYATNDKNIIKINSPKVVGDFSGKRLSKNDYFEFDVVVEEEYVKEKSVEYEIVAIPIGNNIADEYIKFYMTDQNNNCLAGYSDSVPLFSVFSNTVEGKIIYSGSFSKNDLSDKYRLRIWISDKYKGDVSGSLTYQLQVRIK